MLKWHASFSVLCSGHARTGNIQREERRKEQLPSGRKLVPESLALRLGWAVAVIVARERTCDKSWRPFAKNIQCGVATFCLVSFLKMFGKVRQSRLPICLSSAAPGQGQKIR